MANVQKKIAQNHPNWNNQRVQKVAAQRTAPTNAFAAAPGNPAMPQPTGTGMPKPAAPPVAPSVPGTPVANSPYAVRPPQVSGRPNQFGPRWGNIINRYAPDLAAAGMARPDLMRAVQDWRLANPNGPGAVFGTRGDRRAAFEQYLKDMLGGM